MAKTVSLDDIGRKYGTDKSSLAHNYLGLYQERLSKYRGHKFVMAEIGVFSGDSLAMWGEFFANADIVGIDINPKAQQYAEGNKHVVVSDASLLETIDLICERFGRPTIVLDDGSHFWHHQIESLRYWWPKIVPGGIFIMEDIHTSFPTLQADYRGDSDISAYDYILRINKWMVGGEYMGTERPTDGFISNYWKTVDSIEFRRNTILLNKK